MPEIPLPIIRSFAKQRICIRIKYENIKIANEKNQQSQRGIAGRSKSANK